MITSPELVALSRSSVSDCVAAGGYQTQADHADAAPPPAPTLTIRPWVDPIVDRLGHDPRSPYVEEFWLGILGPSTTWLLRRLAAGLEASPIGFDLDLAETATLLGLGAKGGRHSPFMRSLARCVSFDLAAIASEGVLAVRRRIPPLTNRQVLRLPASSQALHRAWAAIDPAKLHP